MDTQEATFKAVFNYCILNPFASNTLFDEQKRVMFKATLNVGIGFDIKCTDYYFQTLMNVRTIHAKMELSVPTFIINEYVVNTFQSEFAIYRVQ